MKTKAYFVAAIVALSPVVVSAGTIDFTASATYNDATSSTITGTTNFGVGFTVTGKPINELSFSQDYDGISGATGGLAEQVDGLGVRDDEISNAEGASVRPNSRKQAVTVAFDTAVRVTGLHFLDLFLMPDNDVSEGEDINDVSERMQVWINKTDLDFSGNGHRRVKANAPNGDPTGYRFADVTKGNNRELFKVVNTISFTSSRGNDIRGDADGALAGIDVAPVPLPAAGVLLLGALGGLGGASALRRRRKTA